MARKNKTTNTNDAARNAAMETIRQHLGLETLETRKRDSLDFHDVSVADLRAIINIAFDAGLAAANTAPAQPTEPEEMLATLKITETSGRATGGTWVSGTIAGHDFEALVFKGHALNAEHELGTSRISKLFVQEHFTHVAVAAYDRGWEIEPTTDAAKKITDLLAAGLAETVFGK